MTLTSSTYGGPSDLWGTTWTPDDINSTDFGAVVAAYRTNNGNNDRTATVDYMQITIAYTYASTTSVDCGSGNHEVTYGDSLTCVATVARVAGDLTPSGTVSWTTDGSGSFEASPCMLSGSDGTSTCSVSYTPSAVGSSFHLITATYSGDTFIDPSSGSQTISVTPRLVTITADAHSKVYGDGDPELTYQITDGSLAFSDIFTSTLTRDPGENVGTYPILEGSLALSDNYDLTYVGTNLTITHRPVEITADAQTKIYGEPDPNLTYQITDGSLVFSDTFTGTLTREPGEAVGTYAILQGTLALSDNYDLTYIGSNLRIVLYHVTVTADALSKVVGEAVPVLTYKITDGSLLPGDVFTGNLTRQPGENIGTYAIQQGTLSLPDYYDMTYVGAYLTITGTRFLLPLIFK